MRIPEVAARLREIAVEANLPELDELADELKRRKPRSRAPVASTPMTPELRAQIRKVVAANPEASRQDVAHHFGVNPGRVTEAVRGKRT